MAALTKLADKDQILISAVRDIRQNILTNLLCCTKQSLNRTRLQNNSLIKKKTQTNKKTEACLRLGDWEGLRTTNVKNHFKMGQLCSSFKVVWKRILHIYLKQNLSNPYSPFSNNFVTCSRVLSSKLELFFVPDASEQSAGCQFQFGFNQLKLQ